MRLRNSRAGDLAKKLLRRQEGEAGEIVCGAVFSVAVALWLVMGEPQTKWVVCLLAGLLGCLFLLTTSNTKKLLLILFVLCLQTNVNFFLIVDKGSRWVGASGAEGISVPIIAIPALLLLMLAWFKHRWRIFFVENQVVIPFVLVALTAAMTLLYSPEKRRVIYNLVEMATFFVVLLAAVNTIKSREDFVLAIKVLMTIIVTQSLIYFVQDMLGFTFTLVGEVSARAGEQQRHGGTVHINAKGFSSFIVPLLLIGVSRYLIESNRRVNHWFGVVCGLGVASLIMTFTRMSWVGFCLGCLWIVGISLWRRKLRLDRLIPLLVVGAVAVVVLLPRIMIRLADDAGSDLQERLYLMKLAWMVIQAHPWLGIGSGAYGDVFREYITGPLYSPGVWIFVVHNTYLLRWAETGIFGLLCLLVMLVCLFRLAQRSSQVKDETMSAVAIGWGAGLISSMWEMFWDIALGLQTSFLFWFMVGMMLAIKRIERATTQNRLTPHATPWAFAPWRQRTMPQENIVLGR